MNLLPDTEKEGLKKGLKLRSLILGALVISISFLAGLIMLVPSYFLTLANISNTKSENYSSVLKEEVSVKQVVDLPEEINYKMNFLQSYNENVSVADSISQIIKYLPAGVKLNSVSFEKNQVYKEKTGIIILVSGIAFDRDSLVNFSTSLKESKLFSEVNVPVSSLTKGKDLPFSMNIFIENGK
ncbi:MAG: PilN domain-containing protein [Patescibacteria group bacterium]